LSLAEHVEHTLLKPEATAAGIRKLCREAKDYHLLGVCINPCYVALAKTELAGTPVKVVTVVGFPLGADVTAVKAAAARQAVRDGADEVDMVLNVGAVKDGAWERVCEDIAGVVQAAAPKPVKVIIEACLLTDAEKVQCCEVIARAGAAFVKTSTGFNKGGATVADVKLLAGAARKLHLQVKAAGGIRDAAAARAMLAAGAERLGTSAGVAIAAADRDGSRA
jgi:deoxyribose-phosphate aldolase